MVASNTSPMPDSNSSGTSTPAARGEGDWRSSRSRHCAILVPTRGHSRPSSQARPSSLANAALATAARSIVPSAETTSPNRSVTAWRTSGSSYSSWTTASVESTAAPRRSSASSAVDFPAPIPPVSPTNGTAMRTRPPHPRPQPPAPRPLHRQALPGREGPQGSLARRRPPATRLLARFRRPRPLRPQA